MKIMVDPGHSGRDPGAIGHLGNAVINEKDLNLKIGSLVKSFLTDAGHEVQTTRSSDVFIPLNDRVKMSDEFKSDLFISIHCDASENHEARGYTGYYYSEKGKTIATHVIIALDMGIPALKNRGVSFGNFEVLRDTACPAILIECGFVSNTDDLIWLNSATNQIALAKCIAGAI
jgi:N-acetylmuramoyl-L-alanine amidase